MTVGAGRLARDWRAWLMGAVTAIFLVAALLVDAVPQPQSYHAFADCRAFLGVTNFLNVASNIPFLVAGALGLALIWRGRVDFIDPREQLPYLVFFLGALITCFGSAWYHAAPDNARLVWDRMPMTLAFAGLVAAAVAERMDLRLGLRSLLPLLLLGVVTVLYWYGTERLGRGNLVPYAAYQTWAIVIVVVVMLAYPAHRYTHGGLLAWAAAWYGLAKLFETFDLQIYRLTGSLVSGHTVKHVLASFAVFAIVRQLRVRHRIPAP